MHFALSFVQNDISQSAVEFIQLRAGIQSPTIGDVNRLADLIAQYHSDKFNYHVITVTHSQGNMVLAQALQQLPAKEGRPLQSRYCTGELSLAAPINAADFGMDQHFLRGIDFNGDILGVLGLPNDFAHIDNDSSRAGAAELASLAGSLPLLRQYKQLRWGSTIHGVDYNYFTSPEGVAAVTGKLAELYDECMVGSIVASPNPVTVPLGDSVKVGFSVFSRAGHLLQGRVLSGGGIHSIINSDSFVVATGPTATETASIMTAPWLTSPLGTLAVTVPTVAFPGHIAEHRTSIWVSTGGFSDNTSASGIPPAPDGSPGWDGTPGGCAATTTTTAGNAWTSWAQQCSRTYVLEIPADPLPGGTRLLVLYADYPSGPFHGPTISSPVPPHTAITDTLPYHCGPEYCLRATVLQSRTAYDLLVKSDTTCFSDGCGASASRVPTTARRTKSPVVQRGALNRGGNPE
jgi:hypothetical protein